ncbi:MAG: GH3 auxin-responsive promoter family protein [Actinomycetota bacterium]|nr:GH3 auxin-responsive promoter family protein [Actinomycetota bacterium]
MSRLIRFGLGWRGRLQQIAFDRAAENPEAAQRNYLLALLRRNQDTAFGREHGFRGIQHATDYAQRVPIRNYARHQPWIDRLKRGDKCVLTADEPLMFATTSGTTSEPKFIPLTAEWLRELKRITTLWLYRSQVDYPSLFDSKSVTVVSPAVEGRTASGTPVGSVSGLTYQRTPWMVRRSYALPYDVSEITDYDDRYFVAARMALAADVSMLAVPNPSTLLRLVEEGREHSERIVRAVHDGSLGVVPPEKSDPEQRSLYSKLDRAIRPDQVRARFMGKFLERHGALLPRDLWPRLPMIGCWLGGSAGVQANRLLEPYGLLPLRDVGLRATEGTMTIPLMDGDAAGPLTVGTGFYEFIPEEDIDAQQPQVRLAHELENGKRYYILMTTSAGLYRYDINDIVEVHGFYKQTPRLAFVRKGRDMVNLTGEKLHSSQVGEAAELTGRELALAALHVQVIPDDDKMHYDLLVECEEGIGGVEQEFADVFDRHLAEINIEYAHKRRSRRLGRPRLWPMKLGWARRRRRRDVEESGKRDTQYKWPMIQMQWDDESRADVLCQPDD